MTDDEFDWVAVLRLMEGDRSIPVRRRGVLGNPLTPEAVEAIRRLAAKGLNGQEISGWMNGRFSAWAVYKHRLRHGISPGVPCNWQQPHQEAA